MKNVLKKVLPVMLMAGVLALSGVVVSCGSSSKSSSKSGVMYERHQSNSARKVKSNIKVRGTNKANSHTTRTY